MDGSDGQRWERAVAAQKSELRLSALIQIVKLLGSTGMCIGVSKYVYLEHSTEQVLLLSKGVHGTAQVHAYRMVGVSLVYVHFG